MAQRIALFVCGVMTVLIGRVYLGLGRLSINGMSWSPFSYALLVVGMIAVFMSLLPSAWVQKPTTKPTERRRSTPLRFLLSFAALGLLLVAILSFVPPSLARTPMPLVYSLCPAYVVTVTVDASMRTALLVFAPLNALVFGAIGGVVGTAYSILSR